MKKYLLEHGLRPHRNFAKAVGIESPATLDSLLVKAQAYIQYEEKEAANNAKNSKNRETAKSSRSDEPSTSR